MYLCKYLIVYFLLKYVPTYNKLFIGYCVTSRSAISLNLPFFMVLTPHISHQIVIGYVRNAVCTRIMIPFRQTFIVRKSQRLYQSYLNKYKTIIPHLKSNYWDSNLQITSQYLPCTRILLTYYSITIPNYSTITLICSSHNFRSC